MNQKFTRLMVSHLTKITLAFNSWRAARTDLGAPSMFPERLQDLLRFRVAGFFSPLTARYGLKVLCGALAMALVSVSGVAAQDAAGNVAGGALPGQEAPTLFGALVQMLPMLAVCYLIFYFMVIRPQEAKNKQLKSLMDSLKRGDSVVTTSGMIGRVAGIESDHIVLEIAPNTKVKFLRSCIARLEVEPQKSKAA
jgi:preprotein translocase subunit YajC